jgi:hypothetical protein
MPAPLTADPSWSDIVALVLSAGALTVSAFALVLSRRPVIQWRLDPDPNGPEEGQSFRLVNTSDRFAALVTSLSSPDQPDPDSPVLYFYGALPAMVEPGSSLPVVIVMYQESAPRVEVKWRQRHASGRFVRPWERTRTLYR